MEAQYKQRDATSFPFHFEVWCLAQTNYVAIFLIQYKYEREHDKTASFAIKKLHR